MDPADITPPTTPGSPQLSQTGSDATGVTYSASWAAASDDVGVRWYHFSFAFDDGSWSGSGQGRINETSFSLPFHTSGLAASGSFCVLAEDAAGNQSVDSSCAALNVPAPSNEPDTTSPLVAITAPATDATYLSAQTVQLAATASDDVGVTSVEFYDGAVLVHTDVTNPYTFGWSFTGADNGSHSFTATAYDMAGNSSTSEPRVLTVDVPLDPPSEAILFASDWSTATGNSLSAISDGDKWTERFCVGGAGQLIRVVPRSTYAGLPSDWPANLLQVDHQGTNCDNVGVPGNRWPMPDVGETVYFRLLAYLNKCGLSTGPVHNVQSNIGAIAWTVTEDQCQSGQVPTGFKSYLHEGGRQFVGSNITELTPLRYEWALTRASTTRFTARVRVYNDATDTLIFDETTLDDGTQTLAEFNQSGGFSYSNAGQVFTEAMLGAQGPNATGSRTGAYNYAGFAVCTDWCGRYQAGEAD